MATNNTVNRIELIGYMGAMPDMRYTANGAPVTNFSMATNRIWRDQSGETCKATDWHRVTAWGRLAEVVNQYMGKGKRVRVIGRLEYQTWNDKTTGEQRSRAVIVASQVLFLDYDRARWAWPRSRRLKGRRRRSRSRMLSRRPSRSAAVASRLPSVSWERRG
jgi:single-strand DNA-binding protein